MYVEIKTVVSALKDEQQFAVQELIRDALDLLIRFSKSGSYFILLGHQRKARARY